MSHVYCPECGFQNPEAANYCSKCGAALVRDAAALVIPVVALVATTVDGGGLEVERLGEGHQHRAAGDVDEAAEGVDRGNPRHDLLGCFDLGDVAVLGHQPASCHRWGRFGAAREPGGNRNSDRRAQGNSARPCCRAPAPD
jgi:hypothetical protein